MLHGVGLGRRSFGQVLVVACVWLRRFCLGLHCLCLHRLHCRCLRHLHCLCPRCLHDLYLCRLRCWRLRCR